DPHVHKASVVVEQSPAQIVESQRSQGMRLFSDQLLDRLPVAADGLRTARLDLGDDGEPVGGRHGHHRTKSALLNLLVRSRQCYCSRLDVGHNAASSCERISVLRVPMAIGLLT